MKKVIYVNVGGISFTLEEEAYFKLKNYLDNFEATIPNKADIKEIMEDIELRIAEIFRETIKYNYQVVDLKLVNKVIDQMGLPEGEPAQSAEHNRYNGRVRKRLYRNPDDSMVAGICGGLAAYLGIDSSIMRIAALIGVIFAGLSIWVYVILLIVVPRANTIAEKLEMYGEPVTAENIRNYSANHR